jgi:uncharacterized protein
LNTCLNKVRVVLWGALALLCFTASAGETIPAKPAQYFNDYAGVVSGATADRLNQQLAQFEWDSSDQIVVAIYSHMQSDSSIEDYTVRVAQSWQVGQKGKNNGAVLFVFTQDRKLFIATGYGLEGVLPDITCKRIIDNEITPNFKAGNYDAGLTAGVDAIIAAAKGEYKGTGQTYAESHGHSSAPPIGTIIIFIVIVLLVISSFRSRSYGGWFIGGGGGGWSSGGGSWGGGGGGFSSGGGSFGGGGAGGSW